MQLQFKLLTSPRFISQLLPFGFLPLISTNFGTVFDVEAKFGNQSYSQSIRGAVIHRLWKMDSYASMNQWCSNSTIRMHLCQYHIQQILLRLRRDSRRELCCPVLNRVGSGPSSGAVFPLFLNSRPQADKTKD